ncbi:MAG TPA: hypothetical protein VGM23_11205 [Armatimonadota bacterium]|jgi:hypothetical protein
MVALTGCIDNAAALTGVQATGALGTLGETMTRARTSGTLGHHLDAVFSDAYLVPSPFTAGVSKMELLKDAEDPSPYLLFDTNDVAAPRRIVMSGGQPVVLGSNPAYPAAGTYTIVRLTLIYLEMTINADTGDGAGVASHTFRLYASSVGNVLHGDLLILVNGEWCWMSSSKANNPAAGQYPLPVSNPRPGGSTLTGWTDDTPLAYVVQDHNWAFTSEDEGYSMNVDPYVAELTLTAPMVVPASPSGLYVISMIFDVTKTPQYADSEGMFMFTDLPLDSENPASAGDGIFKPGVAWASGGDAQDVVGAKFDVPPPYISVSYTQE